MTFAILSFVSITLCNTFELKNKLHKNVTVRFSTREIKTLKKVVKTG